MTTSWKNSTTPNRRLKKLCCLLLTQSGTCTNPASCIEILNLKILSIPTRKVCRSSKLLILGYLRSLLIKLLCLLPSALLSTWRLKYLEAKNIGVQLIFGLSELFSTFLCVDIRHLLPKTPSNCKNK